MSNEDQEAVWRDIVEHYGDRPQLADDELGERPEPLPDPGPADRTPWAPEDHYVPPAPPPVPRPTAPRALAWLGMFGAPVVVLVLLVLGVTVPSWLGFLLFCAFVGGFVFLVATMRKDDDSDPWDDGAVV
jgi:hypothetical protein